MSDGSANWSWEEIEPLIATLEGDDGDLIVCGGQAVAFWAARYGLGVLVSRDLDFVGDRAEAQRLAAALGAEIHYPHPYDMTVLTAVLRVRWHGRFLDIELLNSVPGLESDPEAISVRVTTASGRCLRVLDATALAIAKLHALRSYPQEERRDAAHLGVTIEAARWWLVELVVAEPARALRWIHRWYRFTRTAANRRVLGRAGLEWVRLVPLDALREAATRDELVDRFLRDHWPRLERGA